MPHILWVSVSEALELRDFYEQLLTQINNDLNRSGTNQTDLSLIVAREACTDMLRRINDGIRHSNFLSYEAENPENNSDDFDPTDYGH